MSRLTSGSSGGDWTPWRRRLSWKTTSLVFSLFNCKLFLHRPRCNVVESARESARTLSRDDEVRIVSCELDEVVAGVKRLKIGGCNGVRPVAPTASEHWGG